MVKPVYDQPIFDRIPPQSLDAERSVLGAILLDPDAIHLVVDILRPGREVFYSPSHQYIYEAFLSLHNNGDPIDAVTVLEKLKEFEHLEESGGGAYIGDLTGAVPTSANVEMYAGFVLDAWRRRTFIAGMAQNVSEAYQDASLNVLTKSARSVLDVVEQTNVAEAGRLDAIAEVAIDSIEAQIKSGHVEGVGTGLPQLDDIVGGWRRSEIIIIGARPSVGKSALAINFACHAAITEKKHVLFFSLEMSARMCGERILACVAGVNVWALKKGFGNTDRNIGLMRASMLAFRDAEFYIADVPGISVGDLSAQTHAHIRKHGPVDLVVVDYLQLMSGMNRRGQNREQEVAEISRRLKALCLEVDAPVIALSQLSREGEGENPGLSTFRESGAIEQDGDVAILLSRKQGEGEIVHVNVAKQRNGPVDSFDVRFNKAVQRFEAAHVTPLGTDRG